MSTYAYFLRNEDAIRWARLPENIQLAALRLLAQPKRPPTFVDYWQVFHYLVQTKAAREKLNKDRAQVPSFEFCKEALKAGYNIVSICPNCYVIQGFYKTPDGMDRNVLANALVMMRAKEKAVCPNCLHRDSVILKSEFLQSGKTLLWVTMESSKLSTNEQLEYVDKLDLSQEILYAQLLQSGDSESEIEAGDRLAWGKRGSFSDIVKTRGKRGKWLTIVDEADPLYAWTAFGRFEQKELGNVSQHAEALLHKNKYNELLGFCKETLAKGNHDDEDRCFLLSCQGMSHFHLAQYEDSIVCFNQALKYKMGKNQASIVWCYKGGALARILRPEEARFCFDQCLALDPDNAVAKDEKAKLGVS